MANLLFLGTYRFTILTIYKSFINVLNKNKFNCKEQSSLLERFVKH